jgi:Spy/CpxP family protein refolding chaperone
MSRNKTRILPALALAVLPLAPLFATGASGATRDRSHGSDRPYFDDDRMERRAEHQAERLTRALDLTPEQQVTLGRLQAALENAISPLGDEMRSAHQQLRTLHDTANPEPVAVGNQAIAMDRARDGMRSAWERFETDFAAILSETQRAAYRAIQETRPDRGRFGDRGDRRGHDRHGRHDGPPPQH